jgi:hypothetical protein
MKKVYDEKFGTSYECDCAEDWLELITGIAVDYDGYRTVEGLKSLIDEMADYASKARVCLYEGNVVRTENPRKDN